MIWQKGKAVKFILLQKITPTLFCVSTSILNKVSPHIKMKWYVDVGIDTWGFKTLQDIDVECQAKLINLSNCGCL